MNECFWMPMSIIEFELNLHHSNSQIHRTTTTTTNYFSLFNDINFTFPSSSSSSLLISILFQQIQNILCFTTYVPIE
ncbi:hypothetical protein DERP_006244 [Dermatophagoides pteronyssinus]|uniref:Uncharacterized protein n=1 Tax=Dermatophagoides pteronyssinus TaxID=6956 RepID=A0ABQ8IXW6_DERPT|nr:hypothetical protein DERP_006244 [Dermatophagoides pteronyssinus]